MIPTGPTTSLAHATLDPLQGINRVSNTERGISVSYSERPQALVDLSSSGKGEELLLGRRVGTHVFGSFHS